MEKPNLDNKSTYEKVRTACEYILKVKGNLNHGDTLSSAELFALVKENFSDDFSDDFAKNTFYQYLSNTVKDADSAINCLGRRQGYYLAEVAEGARLEPAADEESGLEEGVGGAEVPVDAQDISVRRRLKEPLLYPVLESWLIAQDYQAADVSSGRSLGKWGNPDVAGISAIDAFNGLSIELVTVEAKVSLDGWEQWIFEAVSHRRFANRAYFAFAHPEETVSKIPQDMRYYSELFGVGVLVLAMDNENFKALHAGELNEPLGAEDVEVIEFCAAKVPAQVL
ncbi:MAG: hypothetical protein L0338_27065 [Acidobacteria bacterium]|nr:hypothetical protein [Acidobacteriota bacterium]